MRIEKQNMGLGFGQIKTLTALFTLLVKELLCMQLSTPC